LLGFGKPRIVSSGLACCVRQAPISLNPLRPNWDLSLSCGEQTRKTGPSKLFTYESHLQLQGLTWVYSGTAGAFILHRVRMPSFREAFHVFDWRVGIGDVLSVGQSASPWFVRKIRPKPSLRP